MTRPSRRDRILDTALELFNAAATGSVSTNHIAEALGISPGNLYYHFANKEEIVRDLFGRIVAGWADTYAVPRDRALELADVEAMLRGNFRVMWHYRFFFRDLSALLERDAGLAAAFRLRRAEGIANFRLLLGFFTKSGVLSGPDDPAEIDEIAHLLWLIGDYWLTYLDQSGVKVGPEHMEQGVGLMRRVLAPYMETTT